MSAFRPAASSATVFVVAAAILAAVAFFAAVQTARADESVSISGLAFGPADVTIGAGETVTWTHNDGELPHTVTSTDGGPLDSGTLADGEDYAFTFEDAGTYEYNCTIHPNMTGTITVEAAAGSNGDDDGNGDSDEGANGDSENGDGDDAAPTATTEAPSTGSGDAGSGSGAPWLIIGLGIVVVVVGGGLMGARMVRNR